MRPAAKRVGTRGGPAPAAGSGQSRVRVGTLAAGLVVLATLVGVGVAVKRRSTRAAAVARETSESQRTAELLERLRRVKLPDRLTLDGPVWNVPVYPDDPTRGPPAAPVTLVEFCDYEGPHCRRLADTLAELVQRRGDALRVVWKDSPDPQRPRAGVAAQLVRELYEQRGAGEVWRHHRKIFEQLPTLSDPLGRSLAALLGQDPDKPPGDAVRQRVRGKLEQSRALALALNVRATPVMFINGRRVDGDYPLPLLDAAVAGEIERVASLAAGDGGTRGAGGVAAATGEIYRGLVEEGRRPDVEGARALLREAAARESGDEERRESGEAEKPNRPPSTAEVSEQRRSDRLEDVKVSARELRQVEAKGFGADGYVELVRAHQRQERMAHEILERRRVQGLESLKPTPARAQSLP